MAGVDPDPVVGSAKKAVDEMMKNVIDALEGDINKLISANKGNQLDGVIQGLTRDMIEMLKKRMAEASSPPDAARAAGADGGPTSGRRRPNRR